MKDEEFPEWAAEIKKDVAEKGAAQVSTLVGLGAKNPLPMTEDCYNKFVEECEKLAKLADVSVKVSDFDPTSRSAFARFTPKTA